MSPPFSLHSGGATGVLAEPRPRRPRPAGPPGNGDDGGDDRGGGGGGGGGGFPRPSADGGDVGPFALGLVLLGIGTFFAVLVFVALILRRPAPDWKASQALAALEALWISTALLFASSVALEAAARRARRRPDDRRGTRRGLLLGLLLGAGFLVAQVLLWTALWRGGLVPSSSGFAAVFFVCTGVHALHVLGGLGYSLFLARRSDPGPTSVRLAAVYWHFMGLVWVVLFAMLYVVR